MIRYFLGFISLLCIMTSGFAQHNYAIDTIQYQGKSDKLVNFVILGDGYTAEEQDKFIDDAKHFIDYFYSVAPLRNYKDYFNVFAIKTISAESGAIHACTAPDCPKEEPSKEDIEKSVFKRNAVMPASHPKTIFGSTFDSHGIHRLVVPQHEALIDSILRSHVPDFSEVLVLVNSAYYGGSGGKYATATVNVMSNDIAIHEIGHSFAKLGDEYWAGNQYAFESANRTNKSNPAEVPWKNWIGVNGIGIFSYGNTEAMSNWYRPHENCKMQRLSDPFCSVCQEAFVKSIYRHASPVLKVYPKVTDTINNSKTLHFDLDLAKPNPNTLKIEWFINDRLLTTRGESISLDPAQFRDGDNIVKAIVTDTTFLIRDDTSLPSRSFETTWNVTAQHRRKLNNPSIIYGDSLETCFGKGQVVNIHKPIPDVRYNWYSFYEAKEPIASGPMLYLDRVVKSKRYFVEAEYEGKVSERIGFWVMALPEVGIQVSDLSVSIDKKEGLVVIKDLVNHADFTYSWTLENGGSAKSWDKDKQEYSYFSKDKKEIVFKIEDVKDGLFVQKRNKKTLCEGVRQQINLTDYLK